MANPQREDGHVDIANEIVEALARVNLSAYEWRVLMVVFRKCYGWQKKVDFIAVSQIAKMTGLRKQHASRAKLSLLRKALLIDENGRIGFNKDYDCWGTKGVTSIGDSVTSIGDAGVTDLGYQVTSTGDKSSPLREPQKTIKPSIQMKIFRPNSDEFRLSELLLNLILERKPDFKKPNLQNWSKHIDRMIRLDKRTPERIEAVIRWCQADPFWQTNILSSEKLRTQFDQLEMKVREPYGRSGICENSGRETTPSRRKSANASNLNRRSLSNVPESAFGITIET
jgi:phage replication O-like protein O